MNFLGSSARSANTRVFISIYANVTKIRTWNLSKSFFSIFRRVLSGAVAKTNLWKINKESVCLFLSFMWPVLFICICNDVPGRVSPGQTSTYAVYLPRILFRQVSQILDSRGWITGSDTPSTTLLWALIRGPFISGKISTIDAPAPSFAVPRCQPENQSSCWGLPMAILRIALCLGPDILFEVVPPKLAFTEIK